MSLLERLKEKLSGEESLRVDDLNALYRDHMENHLGEANPVFVKELHKAGNFMIQRAVETLEQPKDPKLALGITEGYLREAKNLETAAFLIDTRYAGVSPHARPELHKALNNAIQLIRQVENRKPVSIPDLNNQNTMLRLYTINDRATMDNGLEERVVHNDNEVIATELYKSYKNGTLNINQTADNQYHVSFDPSMMDEKMSTISISGFGVDITISSDDSLPVLTRVLEKVVEMIEAGEIPVDKEAVIEGMSKFNLKESIKEIYPGTFDSRTKNHVNKRFPETNLER